MSKNKIRVIAFAAIALVVFNVIAFVIPIPKSAVFWVAYIFGMLAIEAQLLFMNVAFSGKEDIRSKFYGFPIARMNGFLQNLYMDIDENIDRNAVKKHFKKMEKWFNKRNNLIHGLVNKIADDDFESEIKTIAEESEALWRFLDKELVYKLNNCKLREKYQIG